MANYNTFVVVDYNKRKNVLVTSSARKADKIFAPGMRIEVWCNNEKVETIYYSKYKDSRDYIWRYIVQEKEFIRNKQLKAEYRNKRAKLEIEYKHKVKQGKVTM